MENEIKRLRKSTNKSQREFASTYNIPLSTLKKWEQNESNPPSYVLSLLTSAVDIEKTLVEISDVEHTYYYDPNTQTVYNKKGDSIKLEYNILKVKKNNLLLYLEDIFKDYYKMKNEFIVRCNFDRKENVEWIRMK